MQDYAEQFAWVYEHYEESTFSWRIMKTWLQENCSSTIEIGNGDVGMFIKRPALATAAHGRIYCIAPRGRSVSMMSSKDTLSSINWFRPRQLIMRKLLPYEQHLIATLGISEEEYWQFYLARLNYKDEKEGTILDVRAEAGTIALVLTIVGTLAQVGAALLAPKPEAPSQTMGRRARNTFFAPRYGFNSFQEVARYGDPVNLIYTNVAENTAGGVRVNTSLVWSAVHSLGSRQFMQMLAVVGAGAIEEFAYGRTAFGQTPLRDVPSQRYWLYAQPAGGPLYFSNKQLGDDQDPSAALLAPGEYAYKINISGTERASGYSQAFSPTTATSLGVYDVVPIKVQVEDRDDEGNEERDQLGISIPDGRGIYWPSIWPTTGVRPQFPKDQELTIVFAEEDNKPTEDVERAAIDLRSSYITTFNSSSLYKIGAAKFKLISDFIKDDNDIEGRFTFRCVSPGVLCEEDYSTLNYQQNGEDLRRQKRELEALINQTLLPGKGEAFAPRYTGPGADQIEAFDGRLESIDNNIENATAIIRGNLSTQQIYDIVKNEGEYSGLVNQIKGLENDVLIKEQDKKNRRNDISVKDDDIQDILEGNRPLTTSQRNKIQLLKQQKRALRDSIGTLNDEIRGKRDQINDKLGELSNIVLKKGLYDNNPNTNLKEERRRLKIEKRRLEKERALVARNVARDFAAESASQRAWQSAYDSANSRLQSVIVQLKNKDNWNDYFNTKCIAKIDEIAYEATTKCDVINFCFKSKVFQRIQGRQSKYAEEDMQGHKDSDNGVRNRTALFWFLYRKPTDKLDASGEPVYQRAKYVLAIRNGQEIDVYTQLRFIAASKDKWQFKLEPIVDLAAELRTHNDAADIGILYLRTVGYGLTSGQKSVTLDGGHTLVFRGKQRTTIRLRPRINRTPAFVDEWGLFSLRSDTQISFSFESGPETSLTVVTEQQKEQLTEEVYKNLSMLGLNIYSGQGVQDLRSLSAWVSKGKKVRKLSDDGSLSSVALSSTSFAPEIFLDSVLDPLNGIGAYANSNGIDLVRLGQAQKFCRVNGYYMDGVIAEPQAWREFWSTVAPFSLLEFARIGGKETLIPSVPFDTLGRVTRAVSISALFNQGNILADSYKEEFIDYGDNTQDLIATIVYRNTENDDVFPGNTSLTVRLANASETSSIRQTFNLSDFVTRRTQALHYGMLLCQQRRWSTRAVEFKTFPTESPIAPGSYIYVQTDQNQWDEFYSGIIEANGTLNTPLAEGPISGSYTALLYSGSPKEGTIKLSSVSVTNNQSSSFANYEGWLFVLGNAITTKRVFKVTEVSMEEEGEITVRAIEHPCEESGGQTLSRIANFDAGLFKIDQCQH